VASYDYEERAYFPEELLRDPEFTDWLNVFLEDTMKGDDWHSMHDWLENWLWDEYGLVLDEYFDWADYGDWYDHNVA
jgi:hypothetical protein